MAAPITPFEEFPASPAFYLSDQVGDVAPTQGTLFDVDVLAGTVEKHPVDVQPNMIAELTHEGKENETIPVDRIAEYLRVVDGGLAEKLRQVNDMPEITDSARQKIEWAARMGEIKGARDVLRGTVAKLAEKLPQDKQAEFMRKFIEGDR